MESLDKIKLCQLLNYLLTGRKKEIPYVKIQFSSNNKEDEIYNSCLKNNDNAKIISSRNLYAYSKKLYISR
jgi:hypothetical protein